MEVMLNLIIQTYIPVLLVMIAAVAYFLSRRNRRLKVYIDKLKGPPAVPVLGNLLQLMIVPHDEILSMMNKRFKKYGRTYRFWVGSNTAYVFTCDIGVIKKLTSSQKYICKGNQLLDAACGWLGTGLLTAPANKWLSRRKLITPAFHFKILEDFLPIFSEHASVLIDVLNKDGHDDGKQFNIYPYIAKCTLDIICETAMGRKIAAQTSKANEEYFNAVNGMSELIIKKMFKPWFRIPLLSKLTCYATNEERYSRTLKEFSEKVVRARKKERKLSKCIMSSVKAKPRKAFLDLLLDVAGDNQPLTDNDIREEVDTFIFAGYDTTSVNLGWTILLLALHPECQQIVQRELDEIFAGRPSCEVNLNDIHQMKMLDCCLKEGLRLFPSVPFITRAIDTDLVLDNGVTLPNGAFAVVSIYHLHRLEEYFPEPEKFMPERWTCNSSPHPYSFIPFSAGSRNCIGQKFAMLEEKVVLAKLLSRYSIETNENLETLKILPHVVLRSNNGINVSLRKRI